MKVMSYNILCGGLPVAAGGPRLEDILAVVRAEAPDILALQEANRFAENGLATRIGQELGLPFHALTPGALYDDGERYSVVTFSRWPIRDVHRFGETEFQAGAVAVSVATPRGDIAVCNVHLHAFSEAARLKELALVLAHQMRPAAQIVLGDFNAISARDSYGSDESEFELRFDVTQRMEQDFTDTFADVPEADRRSHPSPLVADHSRTISRRIDYVFTTHDLADRVISARVLRGERADRASDHYPLVVEFR